MLIIMASFDKSNDKTNLKRVKDLLTPFSEVKLDEEMVLYLVEVLSGNVDSELKDDVLLGIMPDIMLTESEKADLFAEIVGNHNTGSNEIESFPPAAAYASSKIAVAAKSENSFVHSALTEIEEMGVSDLDEDIIEFILNAFVDESLDDETEKIELVTSYLPTLAEMESVITKVVDVFEKYARIKNNQQHEKGEEENIAKAASLVNQLQDIKNEKIVQRILSPEEQVNIDNLVKQGFDQEAIKPKFDNKGKAIKQKDVVIFVHNDKLKSKLRYRDSLVVATKGEKFIIEKEEEYDSGCRGRVKSKGKRGAGVGKGL